MLSLWMAIAVLVPSPHDCSCQIKIGFFYKGTHIMESASHCPVHVRFLEPYRRQVQA